MPKPDLILMSGSQRFLSSSSICQCEAPIIWTQEFTKDSKCNNSDFKLAWCKHSANGGCANIKLRFGFRNLNAPPKIGTIERGVGDLIDCSTHPSVMMKQYEFNPKLHLNKDSMISYQTLRNKLILPAYRFASGWGFRDLARKEYFNIWGFSELENKDITLEWLFAVAPAQPANLLLASFFSNERVRPVLPSCSLRLINDHTHFDSINVTINHDWIDETAALSQTRKADNAPIPASLWDKRIMASFPEKSIDLETLQVFRQLGLNLYRKNLRKSFIGHLRQSYPLDWIDYLQGKRSTGKGGNLNFKNR